MANHVFLTGEKQVGKSTLLQKVLAGFPGKVCGFTTRRVNTWEPGTWTVHLLPADGSEVPCAENLLFRCGVKTPDTAKRFDALGCKALEAARDCDLILMDELGPNEETAAWFCSAVLRALYGNIPILGVLQKAPSAFLDAIAVHPCVKVFEITTENRDDASLLQEISLLLQRDAHLRIE